MTNNGYIVGIGSALIDILAHENDDFLDKIEAAKGGMLYINPEKIDSITKQMSSKPKIVCGGAACNTIIGVSQLGAKARFIGKCGNDEFGKLYKDDLIKNNVEPNLFVGQSETGRVVSIITPDKQRSMLTFLGASSEINTHEIENSFNNVNILHIEGYLIFNHDLFVDILKIAKKNNAKISLDLASYTVVNESKEFLYKIIPDYIDILIANEDEAKAFTGFSDEIKALDALSKYSDIAVVKIGKKGSLISSNNNIIKIDPCKNCQVIDTTGAGDLWAAGFLYGISKGFSLEKSGKIASACGFEVCQVIGANIPEDGWKRIKKNLDSI